ncbi:MAG: hypothetical protein MZU91_00185 [Desulfosudis oleivorans]|nr:hypothetical protein [Desulfosudis oleivorans]
MRRGIAHRQGGDPQRHAKIIQPCAASHRRSILRNRPAEVMDMALEKLPALHEGHRVLRGHRVRQGADPLRRARPSPRSPAMPRAPTGCMPSVRTIIDIGGQDCKAIRLDEKGNVVRFITNDKCASGTGRFLEVMAKLLDLSLEDLGELSAKARNPMHPRCRPAPSGPRPRSSMHLNNNMPIEDIVAAGSTRPWPTQGRHDRQQRRVSRGMRACTGGVAKNAGVVNYLEKLLGVKPKSHPGSIPR